MLILLSNIIPDAGKFEAKGQFKIKIESFQDNFISHKDELLAAIEKEEYCSNPVRRVEILNEELFRKNDLLNYKPCSYIRQDK